MKVRVCELILQGMLEIRSAVTNFLYVCTNEIDIREQHDAMRVRDDDAIKTSFTLCGGFWRYNGIRGRFRRL